MLYASKDGQFMEFTKEFMKLNELNIIVVDRMMDSPAKVKQYTLTEAILN